MSNQEAQTKNAKRWSFSEIYRQARELTFAHKELWFLGALGLLISQGSNSSFDWVNDLPGDQGGDVLSGTNGAANSIFDRIATLLMNIWQALPDHVTSLTIMAGIALLILGVVWSIFVYLWVESTLIKGVQKARTEKKVALFRTVRESMKHVPALLWLSIVPMLAIYLTFIVVTIFSFMVQAVLPESVSLLVLIVWIIASLASLPYIGRIVTAIHWATRHAVLEHKSGKEALKSGWKTSHKNILKTIGLGLCNAIVGSILGLLIFVPVSILAVIAFSPVLFGESFQWWTLAPLVLVSIVSVAASAAFQSVWIIFSTATWQFGFEALQAPKEPQS